MSGELGFSVIIPTYNRPRQLGECLASLAKLEPPPGGFEVIVVDDGSPAPLDVVVEPFRKTLDVTLRRKANGGPGGARNHGVAVARGTYLAFTDDDCAPAPDWLVRLHDRLTESPDRLVGGRTVNRLTENPCSATSQLIVDLVYAFYNRQPDDARFFASNNMAMARAMYEKVGGFDAKFFRAASEDRELCDRWRHLGHRMTYAPEAVILHAHPLSLRSFAKQHFAYGRGAARYHALRASRGSGTMRSDMKFHHELPALLRPRLRGMPLRRRACSVVLLGLWQVINAAGFFWEKYAVRASLPERGPAATTPAGSRPHRSGPTSSAP